MSYLSKMAEKTIMVHSEVKTCSFRKYDRKLSLEQAEKNDSDPRLIRVNKVTMVDDSVTLLTKLVNEVRSYHKNMTLPATFTPRGMGLLVTALWDDYKNKHNEFGDRMLGLVKIIHDNYAAKKEEAREALNGAYNEDDYPDVAEITMRSVARRADDGTIYFDPPEDEYHNRYGRFSIRAMPHPIPQGKHWECDLMDSEIEEINKELEASKQEAVDVAVKAIWEKLYTPVKHMAEVLADPKKGFHSTLMGNIETACTLLEAMNFIDDPDLEALRQQAKGVLVNHDMSDIKNDPEYRKTIADDAKKIADKMKGFM